MRKTSQPSISPKPFNTGRWIATSGCEEKREFHENEPAASFFSHSCLANQLRQNHSRSKLSKSSKSMAVTAVLAHHADPLSRDAFAEYLRSHPKSTLRIQNKIGEETTAPVFRVRMCFGRALILLDESMPIEERDILRILTENKPIAISPQTRTKPFRG